MTFYTVHLKPDADPVLVREGFSWGALIFGPLWFLLHGAWIPAALAIAAYLLAGGLLPPPAAGIAAAGLALLLGLSGHDLRRWSLERRCYVLIHVYAARDADAAMLRLLDQRPDIADRFRRVPV